MGLIVLVSGLIPYDSGKTWFTLGGALAAREKGLKVAVFKPVAAHNLWYSPKTVRKSLELKALVGNDILLYYGRGLVGDGGISNPIAIATAPPDPSAYSAFEEYAEDFENVGRIAVLSRIYDCAESKHVHYVHRENLTKMGRKVKRLAERLCNILGAKPRSFNDLAGYFSSLAAAANLNRCLERLEKNSEVVFVESFNDAFIPYGMLIEKIGLIVLVAPGKVYVYRDMKEMRKTAEKFVKGLGEVGFKNKYLFHSVKPDFSIETRFAVRPSPWRAHREFIEKVVIPMC